MTRTIWRMGVFSVLAATLGLALQALQRAEYRVLECPSEQAVAARVTQWRSLYPRQVVDYPAIKQSLMDEQMLLKEALLQGFHLDDVVIQRRFERDLQFLNLGGHSLSADEPLMERLMLGDVVIRRRLLQRMEATLSTEPASPPPLAQLRIDVEQQLFNSQQEAAAKLASKRIGGAVPFVFGDLMDMDIARLAALFGHKNAEVILAAEPGKWLGPVQSPYGWHLLRVVERRERRLRAIAPSPEVSAVALADLRRQYRNECHAS